MARPRKGSESNEPIDWKRGQKAAREARENVAGQLSGALVDQDRTGSIELIRRRAGQLVEAEREGDRFVRRAAAWELALASAAYVVALDLQQERKAA